MADAAGNIKTVNHSVDHTWSVKFLDENSGPLIRHYSRNRLPIEVDAALAEVGLLMLIDLVLDGLSVHRAPSLGRDQLRAALRNLEQKANSKVTQQKIGGAISPKRECKCPILAIFDQFLEGKLNLTIFELHFLGYISLK